MKKTFRELKDELDADRDELYEQLKRHIKYRSVRYVALTANMHPSTISNWINDRRRLSDEKIDMLIDTMDMIEN